MRLAIHAVGRMKAGPEKELADRYLDRLAKAGPGVVIEFGGLVEIQESRARSPSGRMRQEADALLRQTEGGVLLALDERGRDLSSRDLAALLGGLRDEGARTVIMAIGGPDGHDEAVRRQARNVIAFGAQTWPHRLLRIMLAEQLYRAVTILAGHPYHRE